MCSGQNTSMKNNKGQQLLNYAKETNGSCTLQFSSLRSIYQWSLVLIPLMVFVLCSGQNYDGRMDIWTEEQSGNYMSRAMRFPAMWYVRPAKPQISLRICVVWSEPLLVPCLFYQCWTTDWTSFWVSKFKRRLNRLVWVYTCQNATMLGITRHGSYAFPSGSIITKNSPVPRTYTVDQSVLL